MLFRSLHLRCRRIGGFDWRLVTLRPATQVALSTNRFHGTWHILSNVSGCVALARMMWWLSWQKQPGTCILIHGEHIRREPFDGSRSDPVLLTRWADTPTTEKPLRALKDSLGRLGPPDKTLRARIVGIEDHDPRAALGPGWWRQLGREAVQRRGGIVVYRAAPAELRCTASMVYRMRPTWMGTGYHYLGDDRSGEVQCFTDYFRRLKAAEAARQQVLSGDPPADPADLQQRIWARTERLRRTLPR